MIPTNFDLLMKFSCIYDLRVGVDETGLHAPTLPFCDLQSWANIGAPEMPSSSGNSAFSMLPLSDSVM